MTVAWAVTPVKVDAAVQKIVSVGHPQKVILFGSMAKGSTHLHSDADFLVVTARDVASPRRESVRLRRALRGITMPMDILVISAQRLEELRNQPGLIYGEALRGGKVVYDAAD
jgi:predicted nucleotidyltransferase